ncbi:hypothetical protein [Coraliomargarita parva]|uniref:hypothetical protein n=1 Tax=Coraliomargarita parva TaxID=3014050 RepID=UPI0022B47331|nr:hypothetical protein [Coraliomargarita parva]
MKSIIITATLSLLIGFALGYLLKVRETDEYIHVVQVNGTLIEGQFQTIGKEELKALNDLVYESKGADYKILQILVQSKEKVRMIVGISNRGKPHPGFTSEIPMIAEKKDGVWSITKTGLATAI